MPTHIIRFGLLAVVSHPLMACNGVNEKASQGYEADPQTVTAVESGTAIVLAAALQEPPPPGEKATGVIVGEGSVSDFNSTEDLALLAQQCSDGRQVWLRTALHHPTVVLLPSAGTYAALGADMTDGDDLSVVRCVKQAYSGYFTAEMARSGFDPWTADKSPFSNLYQ